MAVQHAGAAELWPDRGRSDGKVPGTEIKRERDVIPVGKMTTGVNHEPAETLIPRMIQCPIVLLIGKKELRS